VIKLVLKIVKNQVEETTRLGAPAIEVSICSISVSVTKENRQLFWWADLASRTIFGNASGNGALTAATSRQSHRIMRRSQIICRSSSVLTLIRWSAIVRGAALRGLHKSFVRKKLCKNHYGITVSRPMELVTGEYDNDDVWINTFKKSKRFKDGEPWVRGYMDWRFKKVCGSASLAFTINAKPTQNDEIRVGDKTTFRSFPITQHYCTKDPPRQTLSIYSCRNDQAPERLKNGSK